MATQVGSVVFQISADLKNLQGQLRTMEGSFQSSFSKIEGLAGNFGKGVLQGLAAGFSLGAITGFGKEILALGDNLQNLHEQTGVTVETLSGIKSTLEESGTSVDAFAKGVFNLQKNLGNIDKETDPAAQAIKRLGLNLNDLRNSSPDDFIKKVTDALAKIENPLERNTVMFNLLGKSAKELGPALAALAGNFDELKRSGLTAADVKALDDIGDALTRLKNQALLLGAEGVAGVLRFFGVLRDAPAVAVKLDAATKQFAQRAGIPVERVEGMKSKDVISQAEQPTRFADPSAMRFARDELLNLREEFERLNKVNVVKPQAVFKGISEGAKSAKKEVDNLVDSFLGGLDKQLASLEGKKIELTFGADAALAWGLDNQFADLKEKLREKNLPVPKGLEVFFANLRDKIVDSSKAVRELNESLEETIKRQQALADEANDGVGILGTALNKDTVARQKGASDQLDELRRSLTIESIDTRTPEGAEQKRIAGILADYETTYKKIQELALQAGLTNEESAQIAALAWGKATTEINNKVDEVTEFQRRAMERAFDTITDLGKDAMAGQIKSWEDLGTRVKKVIDEIVAEWLTLQLKIAVLGPNFGGKTGGTQVGGLLGQLVGAFSGPSLPQGFGARPTGTEGPLLPNGGFFSAPQGGVGGASDTGSALSGIGGLLTTAAKFVGFFHGGGVAGQATHTAAVDPAVFYSARRYHSGVMNLGMNEVPAILERGETVLAKGTKVSSGGGGNAQPAGPTIININNPNFADRRSQAQVLARMAHQVKNSNRNM